jgi:hypothetical protein
MQSAGQTSYANIISGIMWLARHTKDGAADRETVIETLLYSFSTREVAEAALADMASAGYLTDDGSSIRIPGSSSQPTE